MLERMQKGEPSYTAGGRVQTLWKAVWRFLKMLKIEIPFDPGIPLLGIYPKNTALQFEKERCTPMCIAALFTIAKIWKQPKCPS